MGWQKIVIVIGAILAGIGQFVPGYYLALIGAILVLIGALVPASSAPAA